MGLVAGLWVVGWRVGRLTAMQYHVSVEVPGKGFGLALKSVNILSMAAILAVENDAIR